MHNMLRNLSLFLCIILSVTVYGQSERFKKKGLWGYKGKTKNGKDTVLIPPQFEWAGDFDGRLYAKVGKGYNKKDYSWEIPYEISSISANKYGETAIFELLHGSIEK